MSQRARHKLHDSYSASDAYEQSSVEISWKPVQEDVGCLYCGLAGGPAGAARVTLAPPGVVELVPAGKVADDVWARVMALTPGVTAAAGMVNPDTTLLVMAATLPAPPPLAAAAAAAVAPLAAAAATALTTAVTADDETVDSADGGIALTPQTLLTCRVRGAGLTA